METIKLYQTSLVLYSAEEWQNCDKKGSPTSLGFYNPTFGEWDIHIPANQQELEKATVLAFGRNVETFSWESLLFHEYIHFLQHAKGCWDEMIPLGNMGTLPMSKAFKKCYAEEHWIIEAEAHWVMYRPHLLNWKPPKLD